MRGVAFIVAGRLPTKVARPVELQRKSGSKWIKIAATKTSSSGRYSFSTTSTVSKTLLRVYAPKVKIGKKTYSRLTSRVRTVRTVSVTPTSPMPGESFTVVESLGKKGARPAKLQYRSGKKWITIKTVKTTTAGTATFTVSLSSSKTLRVYAPKTKIKKKKYRSITVASFQVSTTTQRGTLSLPKTGITGKGLLAQAQFVPARAGRAVELQQLVGSSWVAVATGTQDATGKATLGVAPSTEGTLNYRAVTAAYHGAAATSTPTYQTVVASGVAEPSIVIGTLDAAVSGDAYRYALEVVGGTAPFTWTASGLPEGLSVSTDGVLSGTSTVPGTYDITLDVTDARGKTAHATTQIVVVPVVGIDDDALPAGIAEQDYTATLTGSGGTAPYHWTAEHLPTGLTISDDGIVTGATSVDGDYPVTITITDAKGVTATKDFTLTVTAALSLTTDTLPTGTVGSAYMASLAATGGASPYSWSQTGLPAGLSLDADTGEISGTPTQAGTFDAVTITVTDDNDYTRSTTFSIEIAAAFAITTTSLPGGVVGSAYPDTTLATIAGTGPFTWSQTGLPTGLSIDAGTGVVSGTPTEVGTFDEVTISVTDSAAHTTQASFTVTVAPAVHITTASLPGGVVGTDYTATLAAADGNSGSYFWTADHLPDGLSFNGNTGVLSGVPTTAGSFDTVTFTVTDEAGKTAEATLTITIAPAVHITTTSLPGGVVGTTYPETTLAAADGNSAAYTWTSTTLPDGLSLSSAGVLTGTPTSSGVYESVKVIVTDGDGKTAEATFSVTIAQAVHITTASLPSGVVGTDYPETALTAADGTGPYTWSSSTLPNGLTLSATGVLSGTPTASGTFDNITVTATDANSKTAEATFTIIIGEAVHITTTSLPSGVVGTDYPETALTAADGNGSYTWSSSTLPAGLALTEAGILSGTPTASGTFDNVSFTVTDEAGKTAEATFTIIIGEAVHITTTSLPTAVVGTAYQTTLAAADGNGSYTWAATGLPTSLTLSASGTISGTPDAAGTYDEITITVTDAAGKTASFSPILTVIPAVHITTASLPTAVVDTAYEATLAAADGTSPYTWTATELPQGLTISESGTISGTPAASVDVWITATVTDDNGHVAHRDLQLVVAPAVHLTTTQLPDGVLNEAYPDTTVGAADGTGPYTWTATGLPAGISLNTTTGVLSGTPTETGTFDTVTITATDANHKTATATFTITVHAVVAVTTAELAEAVANENYSATLNALGGTTPYTWAATGLPSGIELNTNTGELTGSATETGSFELGITVTDAHDKTATTTVTLTVRAQVHITTATVPAGVVGTDYASSIAAGGGTAPYGWSSTTLPAGLVLSESGVLSGTPTADGVTSVTFTVTDAHGTQASTEISLTITPALHITTTGLPSAVVGTEYSVTLEAADGNGAASWSSTALPAGLSLNQTTGELSGTPEAAGTTAITFTATDPEGKTATWDSSLVIAPAVHITTAALPAANEGESYSVDLGAADGTSPYSWSSSELPSGLTLDSENGTISGTPTQAGTFNDIQLTVTDANHKTATATVSLTVLPAVHVTTTTLPSVEVGDAYPSTTLEAADGTTPYSWTVDTLPEGMTLTDGVIAGTPTTIGVTTVTVTVTDAHSQTATAELTITVTEAAHLTSTLSIGVVGGDYTSTLTASGGTAPYTITAGTLPDGLTYSDGVISGTPTAAALNTPVEITVTDGNGKSHSTTLGLTVAAPHPESAGSSNSCAVTPSGGVECWGVNTNGQLGDGTTTNSSYPVAVTGLHAKALSVSTGTNHSCALLATGKIACWGYNSSGQLGTGDLTSSSTAQEVSGLGAAVSVAASQYYTCATLSDGTASCWGQGTSGQLGNGTWVNSSSPSAVLNVSTAMDVETGAGHACILTTSGEVSCWGRNALHQLGANTTDTSVNTPVAIPDVSGVISLGTHQGNHTCAATNTGAVKCWGSNGYGQLGTEPATGIADAVTVPGLSGTVQVIAGMGHSCAIDSAGAMSCWGYNSNGQLGNGSIVSSVTPVAVDQDNPFNSAAAGSYHTCGRDTAGAITCWGNNSVGQIGDGSSSTLTTPDETPLSGEGFTTIDLGTNSACGLTAAGAVKCWGSNVSGQLGDGTNTRSADPVQVTGLTSGVTAISVGETHACAVTDSGAVKCWGSSTLGDGTSASSTTPVTVTGLPAAAVSVAASASSTCARLVDGTVSCWGMNTFGQLGDNSTTASVTPVTVSGLTGVSALSAQGYSACAIASGALKCWGANNYGQLGNSANLNSSVPVDVTGLSSGVSAITVANGSACAIADSSVKCWGDNSLGQLGDGTTTTSNAPVSVAGLQPNPASLDAGARHVCAVTTDGSMQCWGYNASGELGVGSTDNSASPTTPIGLSAYVTTAALGGYSTCALLSNHTVQCWGNNTNDQLGFRTSYRSEPTPVAGFAADALAASPVTLTVGVVGTAYSSGQLTATGGVAPYTWTATGLPAGLSLSTDGSVSGTPTEAGTTEITFTVTDVRGKKDSTTASITIAPAVHITTDTLPSVEAGDAYPSTTLTAADGTPGYTWTSTALPAGLSLSEAGVLSGTPTADGTTTVTFTVTDAGGKTATADLSITITAAAHLTNTALSIGVVGGDYTTTLTADGGTAPYTYAATTLPAGLTLTDGVISGTPTAAGANTPVELTITDAHSKTATATLGLTVVEPKTETGGNATTCAITPTGGIECWGLNSSGQLGDGTTTNRLYPVAVTDLGGTAISVSTGLNHTCAVLSNGKIRCWGANAAGQLGTGDTTASLTPKDVEGIDSAVSIAAGQNYTCATLRDGTASCWGLGTSGQIGNGSSSSVSQPAAVTNLTNLMNVETGGTHACALTTTGDVSCWGRNQYRQIGAGGTAGVTIYNAPVAVPDVSGVVSLSAHMGAFTCATTNTGAVKCWGNNSTYQLGSTSVTASGDALTVPDVTDAVSVIVGGAHVCAINAAGATRCWGYNAYGQLGDGSIGTNSATPVLVSLADPATSAAAGTSHTCARTTTGTISCWGANSSGQLGDGTATDSSTPVAVVGFNVAALAVDEVTVRPTETGMTYADQQLSATGGVTPYSWTASGLPAGLTLSSDGVLAGTPTEVGTTEATFTATDTRGKTASTTTSITTIAGVRVTTSSLPDGLVGASYPATTVSAADGAAPYVWSATGLPTGLSLDAGTGEITGTPTAYGVFSVAITAADQHGYSATTTVPLSVLAIAGATDDVLSLQSGQSNFTCEVTNVGRVKCWGQNTYGQIGDGTKIDALSAKVVDGIGSGVKAVATGLHFACAITNTGGVKCWGYNYSGQLGNGSTTDSLTPVEVTDGTTALSGITAIAAGATHACAVTNAGGVKCWGSGTSGELGNGVSANSSVAVDVKDLAGTGTLTDVTALSGGVSHSCALLSSGAVNCWGANNFKQLGNSVVGSSNIPTTVADLSAVSQISSNQYTTCAVTTAGAAKCWGRNNGGQLGVIGLTTSTPVTPTGLTTTGVVSIAAGAGHTCALTTSGTMCWGTNSSGQLGDGTRINHTEPALASEVTDSLIAITAGAGHMCGLTTSRDVECWGANAAGQLGNGYSASVTSPLEATNVSASVSAVSTGLDSSCAITTSGSVQCWGNNSVGQLGDGTTTSNAIPVTVQDNTGSALVGATALAASPSGQFSCALIASGAVYCWGINSYGQLGRGTETVANTTSSSIAAQVTGLDSGVTAISTGPSTACAVTQAGTVKCWGYNSSGQLGDSTTTSKSYPVDVLNLDHATAVSVGTTHACALIDDGSVKCWGNNSYGQLGDGTNTSRPAPVQVQSLSGATSIATGANYTCAIADGALKCWGYNYYGQLGNGTTDTSLLPADVTGLTSGVSAITTGTSYACAVTTDGTSKCWGRNFHGELGVGDQLDRTTPTIVTEAAPAAGISASDSHTCLVTTTGALQCWGYNSYNELGRITASSTTPQTVLGIRD